MKLYTCILKIFIIALYFDTRILYCISYRTDCRELEMCNYFTRVRVDICMNVLQSAE